MRQNANSAQWGKKYKKKGVNVIIITEWRDREGKREQIREREREKKKKERKRRKKETWKERER